MGPRNTSTRTLSLGAMTELSARLQDALGTAYRVEKELGGGGVSRGFVAEEMRIDRLNREIQLSASLQHPHIVPLLAAGGYEDLLYYTMPFVEESRCAR